MNILISEQYHLMPELVIDGKPCILNFKIKLPKILKMMIDSNTCKIVVMGNANNRTIGLGWSLNQTILLNSFDFDNDYVNFTFIHQSTEKDIILNNIFEVNLWFYN